MGGITLTTLAEILEWTIIGRYKGKTIIVTGAKDASDEVWAAAKGLLDTFADAGAEAEAWVVDIGHAEVRPVNLAEIDEDE
jgi:hypothetical protein